MRRLEDRMSNATSIGPGGSNYDARSGTFS
jgi:hypothetical protein